MSNYLNVYSHKALEEVADFAWENKRDIVIFYPGERYSNGYVATGVYKESFKDFLNSADHYIQINKFETFDELCEYIATSVIGG